MSVGGGFAASDTEVIDCIRGIVTSKDHQGIFKQNGLNRVKMFEPKYRGSPER